MFYFLMGGICLVLGCLSFFKKADFLFMHHRSIEDFQNEYDIKSARQITGLSLFVLSFSFFVTGLNPSMSSFLIGGILISLIVQKVGMNRFASYQGFLKTSTSDKKAGKPITIVSGMFTIIVIILSAITMFIGDIHVDMQADTMRLSAFLTPSKTISYMDIEAIYQEDAFTFGARTFGVGNTRISSGKFRNEQLGNYDLYAYSKNNNVIVIDTKEGYVVFNQESIKQTETLFENLKEKLSGMNALRSKPDRK